MQNSIVKFTFLFNWKYLFWTNFVQKFKIVSLIWNLVPGLIWICRIQGWCSLLMLLTGNCIFEQIWCKKIKIVTLIWNLVPRLIWTGRIQWYCSLFPFSTYKLCPKIHLAFRRYTINLPAVYLQRLEASRFSCLISNKT